MNTFDRTVATVRTVEAGFSFDPALVASGSNVLSANWVMVASAEDGELRMADRMGLKFSRRDLVRARILGRTTQVVPDEGIPPDRSLYNRLAFKPEQSLARAMAEQPPKPGHIYRPVGTEGGRQRFGMNDNSSVFCLNDCIDPPVGKDTRRRNCQA